MGRRFLCWQDGLGGEGAGGLFYLSEMSILYERKGGWGGGQEIVMYLII